jgi:hypothetical protein
MASTTATRDAARRRESQVLELRTHGYTFAKIAEAVGYANAGGAKKAFDRALAAETEAQKAVRDELRAIANLRTERLLNAAFVKATADPGGKAMTNAIRLLERHARLNGYDAPINVRVSDRLDSEIEELLSQLGVEADKIMGAG